MYLNSMWVKLTERNNRTRTKMISDRQELYRFLSTPGVEVAKLMFVSDDVVCASWRYIAEEKVPNIRHTKRGYRCLRHRRGENSFVRLSRQDAKESFVLRHRLHILGGSNMTGTDFLNPQLPNIYLKMLVINVLPSGVNTIFLTFWKHPDAIFKKGLWLAAYPLPNSLDDGVVVHKPHALQV